MRISDWSSDVCSSDLGIDLPLFASISLLRTERGRQALKDYFRPYLELAVQHGVGFVLESASWRASPDWAAPLGLSLSELDALNVASVDLLHELRDEFAPLGSPILASGCMGPRGDGYDPGRIMSPAEDRKSELQSLMRISYAVFCLQKK